MQDGCQVGNRRFRRRRQHRQSRSRASADFALRMMQQAGDLRNGLLPVRTQYAHSADRRPAQRRIAIFKHLDQDRHGSGCRLGPDLAYGQGRA